MADTKSTVKSSDVSNFSILGKYEGECADSNITNLNGLDITREVWETVFNSDEYKTAIDNGWYIGFLGHPEDPNCMDFEHACIVMTEGHIDDNGKVYGKFNLIDTPVGRIVKSFQDAGVIFGISVRGAGDIIDNSVDPESFVFRGFDLVSFPAFPESIPKFSEVAASTDVATRKKYQNICSAVRDNIQSLNTVEAVNIVQSNFAKQSDEYKILESRKLELSQGTNTTDERILAMTQLYLDVVAANKELVNHVNQLKKELRNVDASYSRKLKSIERITSSQISDMESELESVTASEKLARKRVNQLTSTLRNLNDKLSTVTASQDRLREANHGLREKLEKEKSSNLIYKQKIDAAQSDISDKDSIIASLQSELDETVTATTDLKRRASNRDEKIEQLETDLVAANTTIQEYQDAYANMYANALGVRLSDIVVTASTSVSDLQKLISGSSKSSSIDVEPTPIDVLDRDDLITL